MKGLRHFSRNPAPPEAFSGIESQALFLDLDGTLAPISPKPCDVVPDKFRNDLLARLTRRFCGRVAIISGRTISDIDRILEHSVMAVSGVHGLQRRNARGEVVEIPAHPRIAEARAIFQEFSNRVPGVHLEDKGASIALHYRGNPASLRRVEQIGKEIGEATGLVLQKGAMVNELRTPGPNKGDAIKAFLLEAPFFGSRPIFLGDDDTDEAGFQMAAKLGGFGIYIGEAKNTAALYSLANVQEALRWLGTFVEK